MGECEQLRAVVVRYRYGRGLVEGLARKEQSLFACVAPSVANLVEAFGQDVLHEATEHFDGRQAHTVLTARAQDNRVWRHRKDSAVGDCHAMGVATEITNHVFGAIEGALGVDVPGVLSRLLHQALESLGIGEVLKVLKGVFALGTHEGCTHFGTKDTCEGFDRKQKASVAGHPGAVFSQSTSGRDDVDVGMKAQLFGPRVEHQNEPYLCTQSSMREGLETRGCHLKQQRIERLRREARERTKFCGQGKNKVKVRDVEDARSLGIDPALLGERLTLWTMPIATRIVRGMLVATVSAHIEVPSECGGSALSDVGKHTTLLPVERRFQCSSIRPYDVGKLKAGRPQWGVHGLPM